MQQPPQLTPSSSNTTTLQSAVRRKIEEALHRSAGRIYGMQGAAALLGLKPSTLQSKLKTLGTNPKKWRPPLE